jgi:hypothetical protein
MQARPIDVSALEFISRAVKRKRARETGQLSIAEEFRN